MAKPQVERKEGRASGPAVQPLSPSVRRHLGKSLRSFYAESFSEPVSERLEALLAKLDVPKG